MRTNELLRIYLRSVNDAPPPPSTWQRLVWHAADLIRMATQQRNTSKNFKHHTFDGSKFIQEDLFKRSK